MVDFVLSLNRPLVWKIVTTRSLVTFAYATIFLLFGTQKRILTKILLTLTVFWELWRTNLNATRLGLQCQTPALSKLYFTWVGTIILGLKKFWSKKIVDLESTPWLFDLGRKKNLGLKKGKFFFPKI